MNQNQEISAKRVKPDEGGLVAANIAPQRAAGQTLKLIAHQGFQGHSQQYPANSLEAISAAFGVADTVEFDVYAIPSSKEPHKTEVVVIHPEGYFLHVNPKGMKNEDQLPLSLEDALQVTARGRPLIPALSEVLARYDQRSQETGKRTELHIELKGPGVAKTLIPQLRAEVEGGRLHYEDFALTALCYPGDRTRITEARELDPLVRIVLVVRGGDLSVDGFSDWKEVVEFAREQQCDTITGQRRLLDNSVISYLKEEGFLAGCYHSRTSDELEASLALGADYVAADFFQGPSFENYPQVRLQGSPLFQELSAAGLYHLRDWIWELGWSCEGLVKERINSLPIESPAITTSTKSCDAALKHKESGEVEAQPLVAGALSERPISMSNFPIDPRFAGDLEKTTLASPLTVAAFLSDGGQTAMFQSTASDVLASKGLTNATTATMLQELTVEDIKGLAERVATPPVEFHLPSVSDSEMNCLSEVAREFLIRSGRVVGMLAFAALNPRHGARDEYTVLIESSLCRNSSFAQQGAQQQIQAQLLRSGKTGKTVFAE